MKTSVSASKFIRRGVSSLHEARTLFIIAALGAVAGCSMWHKWHGPQAAVFDAPATTLVSSPASPTDTPTADSADATTVAEPTASTDGTRGSGAPPIELRRDPPASQSKKPNQPSGSREVALASSDVGYYMDVLQGQLTQAVGRDARIERRGSSIVLLLPLGFDVDSAQLSLAGQRAMRQLAEILSEYRLTIVAVQVTGPDSAAHGPNSRLASERVAALSKSLTRAGVAGKRISAASEETNLAQGESAPSASLPGMRTEVQVSPIVVGASN